MDLTTKLHRLHLNSTFLTGSPLLNPHKLIFRPRLHSSNSIKVANFFNPSKAQSLGITSQLSAVAVETPVAETDIESLFSSTSVDQKRPNKKSNTGASGISSGVKLENVTKSYKGVTVLKDVTWEVKKGEKVGLVGVNGAGKTTQMRIVAGLEEPDSGSVIKAKPNMKIAFLSQEFEVSMSRTVREEFLSAFKEEMEISGKLERVQKALEGAVEDLDLMGRLLDEFDLLQRRGQAVNLDGVDAKVSKLMPELGFAPEDSDRLVASFSSGWQMRMSLGKILLQVCLCTRLSFSFKFCLTYGYVPAMCFSSRFSMQL
jgi:ABC-type glutathione transport system ATPase component